MTCVLSTLYDVQYGTYLHKSYLQYTLSSFEYVLSLVHIRTQATCIRQKSKRILLTTIDITHYIRTTVNI